MYLKIGDKAPDFSLRNYNGDLVTSSDLKGSDFLLWFFLKLWFLSIFFKEIVVIQKHE